MTPDKIEAAIRARVEVTPALLVQAKAHLVSCRGGETNGMVDAFVAHMGAALVQPVVIHFSTDHDAVVRDVARWLSCQRAAREAVWALIGTGALVPVSERLEQRTDLVAWTTFIPGGGGSSSGWNFGKSIAVPAEVARTTTGATHLTDGDLYLGSLKLLDLDAKIAESLREAVPCFRHDLYLPAQVMLGRAVEGAWTLLGEALIAAEPTERAAISLGKELAKGIHFANLPDRVTSLYTHKVYERVVDASGVRHADLRGVQIWTEAVREARNAVHHAVDAPLPATWETTAALLMGAVPNLQRLWAATTAARAHKPTPV